MQTQVFLPSNIQGNLDRIRRIVERRVNHVFSKFKKRIKSVKVRFSDQNGPRGGEDTKVSVEVSSDSGVLLASHLDSKPAKAVSITLRKARQSLIEKIRKRRGR
jgi:ribosome-associated translation inhibitor RaiA